MVNPKKWQHNIVNDASIHFDDFLFLNQIDFVAKVAANAIPKISYTPFTPCSHVSTS